MDGFLNRLDDYILVINKQGKIEFCNNILLSKLGYKLEELKEQSINYILNVDLKCDNMQQYIEKEKPYELLSNEGKIIKVLGQLYDNKLNSKEYFIFVFKKINNNIEILQKVFDKIPFIVWIKDLSGIYKYINCTFANEKKVCREKVIGQYASRFWSAQNYYNFQKTDSDVVKSKSVQFSEEALIIEGQKKYFQVYRVPLIDDNGNVECIIGLAMDITLNKNLEYQVKISQKNLETVEEIIGNDNEKEFIKQLSNIQNDLIEYLNADGISIWIYNKKEEKIVPYFRMGISSEISSGIKEVKVKATDFYEHLNKGDYEGIKSINDIKDFKNKELILEHDINYFGTYKIQFNDEILGILCISYKNSKMYKELHDDFIKNICNQISILIKNNNLSLELKAEFENRINIESELQCFLETAADLMGIIDKDYYFQKVNGRWSKILGWQEKELLLMNLAEVIYEEDINDMINIAKKLKSEKSISDSELINRIKCKDGKIKWIKWNSKYLNEKNVFIVTGKDITEQKLAENKNKDFEKALQMESVKNEFFANMSHEFKTPLNIILAIIQLINTYIEQDKITTTDNVDLNKYINSIKQNSYRLLRLANNLIDMTKIDSGYYKINLENHNIVNIIEDITMSVAEYVENKGIELIFDTDIEEKVIACDPEKIERIMLNLLSNAIKYTDSDGSINVNLKSDSDYITVSVKDNGIGIPKEKIHIIFKRFMQIDNILTRKCEGSGIGLSLVKSLIEMHGGEISVVSESGIGSEFIFKLPIRLVENTLENKLTHESLRNDIEKCNIEFSDIYIL